MRIQFARAFVVLCGLVLPAALAAQSDADKLLQEGLRAPTIEKNLRVLTDEIGGRVPGTPAMENAVHWGVEAFRAAGADSVKVEPARLAATWSEGEEVSKIG